uniref:ADP-ribosylation factor 1-like 2 n=1 Tax=Meloidogyne hapla TaxID=6305 RepID=A0A1I8BWX7_MELHA
MFKYLFKNPSRSRSLYICHCCFSLQNVNKTIIRTFKSIAFKPFQIVNFYALRLLKGFGRLSTIYIDQSFFDPTVVNLFYKKDKVNPKEWCLVYNFPVTHLASNCFRFCFCFVIGMVIFMLFDYKNNNGKFTAEFSIRIHRDFIITPLNRKDIQLHYNYHDSRLIEFMRYCLHGNAKFGHLGNYGFSDAGFRGNTFRSFILNETENVPKMLDKLDLNDVGGQEKIRPLWRHYYVGTQALIFVVDSADVDRIDEARHELHKIVNDREMREAAILIFANKQDLPGALQPNELQERLGLGRLHSRNWYVQPSCAIGGSGLFEGLTWLSTNCK